MPIIKFLREKTEIEVPEGANLRKEAVKAGINVNCAISGVSEEVDSFAKSVSKYVNCHGFGQCGTCRVKIVKGMENTSPMGIVEKLRFRCPVPTPVTPGGIDPLPCIAYLGNEETMRLACQTKVIGDIEVESSPELNLFGDKFLVSAVFSSVCHRATTSHE